MGVMTPPKRLYNLNLKYVHRFATMTNSVKNIKKDASVSLKASVKSLLQTSAILGNSALAFVHYYRQP